MVENHQKAGFDYNQSARANYGKENVVALTPDGLYFLKDDAVATAPEHEEPPPGLRNLPRTPPTKVNQRGSPDLRMNGGFGAIDL